MTRLRRTTSAVLVAAAASLLASCGVPLGDEPEPVAGVTRPTSASPSPSASTAPSGQATLWLVDGPRLVPRDAAASTPVTTASSVALLGVAPPADSGLRTLIADPVTGQPLAVVMTDDAGNGRTEQRVALAPTFVELAGEDQVLLIGQVVLTMTEIDRAPILFVGPDGEPLSVPLPDGRLRDGSVTRGDYLSLT
ncbi:MAG: hypothetical protein AB7I24_12005 [Candidatus Nanopelagicales bacterium]